jgi:hypothetical protein
MTRLKRGRVGVASLSADRRADQSVIEVSTVVTEGDRLSGGTLHLHRRLRPVLMESAIARGRVLGCQEPHREPPTECLARASSSCHTDASMSLHMDELKGSGARKEYCGG